MNKICLVCGSTFSAPPSSKKITCSRACSSAHRAKIMTGKSRPWSDDARARLSQKDRPEPLNLGTPAAKKSPKSGRFESNINAKDWILISPSGEEFIVRNLLSWARENCELFEKPPTDRSAVQIRSGFAAIARTLEGKRGADGSKYRGAMTYFGWTLKEIPK